MEQNQNEALFYTREFLEKQGFSKEQIKGIELAQFFLANPTEGYSVKQTFDFFKKQMAKHLKNSRRSNELDTIGYHIRNADVYRHALIFIQTYLGYSE